MTAYSRFGRIRVAMGNHVPRQRRLPRDPFVTNMLRAHELAADPATRLNRRIVIMLMAAYGVSQAEIARLAGTHKSTVTRALQNRRNVTAEKRRAVLCALSQRLKTDPRDLCRGRAAA